MSRPTVFVSYSHQNVPALKGVLPYLTTLERDNLVETWSDEKLRGGERWREEINAALDAATVAVLLISQEFLASKFIYEEELPRILQRQAKGGLVVLPVYLSPSTVTSDEIPFEDAQGREHRLLLSDVQGFGTPERPLASLKPAERKRIFVELHQRILELASARADLAKPGHRRRRTQLVQPSGAITRPRIRHIPFPRNRNFTGREKYLRELHNELKSGKPDRAMQALVGLGGIGKTQLALEYCYRFATDYDVLWWVRSEFGELLRQDMRALGEAVGAELEEDLERAVKATVGWLSGHDDWLVVFDNAEHPDVIRPLVPQSGQGRFIITSRYPAWGEIARVRRIGVWKPQEAAAYLARRTSLDAGQAATETAAALGYLPLALAQAGAYIEQNGSGFEGYLDLLKRHPETTLTLKADSSDAKNAVATVWDIALQRVGAANAAAVDLLNLFSFLPSDGISRSLLLERADRLPARLRATVQDPLALDASIGELRRYSLIEVTPEAFSVHRLVQTVVQTRLDTKSRRIFYEAAASLERQVKPPSAPPLWPGGIVPYLLSADLDASIAARVQQAIAQFEEKTVIRFTLLARLPEPPAPSHIVVRPGTGTSSFVGMRGGRQYLTVSGESQVGNIIRSMGHAVGLWNEHSRADRDKYVAIIWENIVPAAHHNFVIQDSGQEQLRPYDYGSIMHYPRDAFSRNGRPTIVPKDDVDIGQRKALSAGDVFLINALYAR